MNLESSCVFSALYITKISKYSYLSNFFYFSFFFPLRLAPNTIPFVLSGS